MRDDLGAFVGDDEVRLAGVPGGPFAGLRFAAKDLYDVEGYVTGCGNPDWRRTHRAATQTADAVQTLVDAGADLVGKTITDELAFSLAGQNHHYGTPINPGAPGRIPGGSSCGSASAVAGGVVDFALGTDTGGSIRVPAALCGICGIRPTHGAVALDGVMPLAPSFDTVGWFARDVAMLTRVGGCLLPPDTAASEPRSLVILEDAFSLAHPPVEAAVLDRLREAGATLGPARPSSLEEILPEGLAELNHLTGVFRTLQGREIWRVHGPWIEDTRPRFGPDIEARFRWSSTISEREAAGAAPVRETVAAALDDLLSDGTVLCLPTTATVAPRTDADPETMDSYRGLTLALTSLAGLGRLPQVTLPAGRVLAPEGDSGPVGLSLISRRGSDRALLDLASAIAEATR
jgi:amidase